MKNTRSAFDLSHHLVRLFRDGSSEVVPSRGPHGSVDGYVISAPSMHRSPPHGGELHPDGDELLYLISGKVQVVLEEPAGPRTVQLEPGQAVLVPKLVWHRVLVQSPCQLVHITPGPGGDHRPLRS